MRCVTQGINCPQRAVSIPGVSRKFHIILDTRLQILVFLIAKNKVFSTKLKVFRSAFFFSSQKIRFHMQVKRKTERFLKFFWESPGTGFQSPKSKKKRRQFMNLLKKLHENRNN